MKNQLTVSQIVEALQATNGLVSLAAKKLGCSPQNIYARRERSPAIGKAIYDSRQELVDHAELALRSAVLDKEAWAVCLVLKTLGKDRGYVERQEVTGAEGGPLTFRVIWADDDA
jgi:hypothetical protein